MAELDPTSDGRRDFDSLIGDWAVEHRRRRERWVGRDEWETFHGTARWRHILRGNGLLEEMDIPERRFAGMSVRLFDAPAGEWRIYWMDSETPRIFPPVVGRFDAGVGTFVGDDVDGALPVRVRFVWTMHPPHGAHWEQAFSRDEGSDLGDELDHAFHPARSMRLTGHPTLPVRRLIRRTDPRDGVRRDDSSALA